ncbi:MAG: GTPase HflX [Acidimicrobiia bacterium]
MTGGERRGRDRRRLTASEVDLGRVEQRALLVGTVSGDPEAVEASLEELALLTDTAGAVPVEQTSQRRTSPDPATFIGRGKAEELRELAEAYDVDVVVFDDELSPAQSRNLEKLLGRDVVDRVALILDIFAQHAHSNAGMLQVELAQLRYRLPRLRGRGTQMSRLGGGIGTRGPGETQLEVDRRRILRRISKLERDLVALSRTRGVQSKARRRSGVRSVALVGYTNAGKSTLLNRLTGSKVLVEDRLFSTLDPTSRRLELPGGERVVLSDTVGFLRRLPHQLVAAFRSTLEEVVSADLLLHVVDASSKEPDRPIEAVRKVLSRIGAGAAPELLVANKLDSANVESLDRLVALGALPISATTGEGMGELLVALAARLRALEDVWELLIPYERGDVLAALHREGEVIVEVHGDQAARVRARLDGSGLVRFADFLVGSASGEGPECTPGPPGTWRG